MSSYLPGAIDNSRDSVKNVAQVLDTNLVRLAAGPGELSVGTEPA